MVVYNCVYLFFSFSLYSLKITCVLLIFVVVWSIAECRGGVNITWIVCLRVNHTIYIFIRFHCSFTLYISLIPFSQFTVPFKSWWCSMCACVCVCLRWIRFSVSGVNVFVNEFCLAVNENITMPHLCDVCCIYGKH